MIVAQARCEFAASIRQTFPKVKCQCATQQLPYVVWAEFTPNGKFKNCNEFN
jgi:hypothetical protein